MAAAKWTTNPREIVITANDDGSLVTSVPFYKDGVKEFTQQQTVTPEGKLTVLYVGAEGHSMTGFYAWSDF